MFIRTPYGQLYEKYIDVSQVLLDSLFAHGQRPIFRWVHGLEGVSS